MWGQVCVGSARGPCNQQGELAAVPWRSALAPAAYRCPLHDYKQLTVACMRAPFTFGMSHIWTAHVPAVGFMMTFFTVELQLCVVGDRSRLLAAVYSAVRLDSDNGRRSHQSCICAESHPTSCCCCRLCTCRHYRTINLLGNMLRRFGNTVTCIMGPIIYQYSARAPFILVGLLLLAWISILSVMFGVRAWQLQHLESLPAHRAKSMLRFVAFGGKNRVSTNATKDTQATVNISDGIGMIRELLQYQQQSFISGEQSYWLRKEKGMNSLNATNYSKKVSNTSCG